MITWCTVPEIWCAMDGRIDRRWQIEAVMDNPTIYTIQKHNIQNSISGNHFHTSLSPIFTNWYRLQIVFPHILYIVFVSIEWCNSRNFVLNRVVQILYPSLFLSFQFFIFTLHTILMIDFLGFDMFLFIFWYFGEFM